MAGKPKMSLAEAQEYVTSHASNVRDLIDEFQEDYYSLLFKNYSISFVPFTDEPALFTPKR